MLGFRESSAAEICLAKNGQVSEVHALPNEPFGAYIWTSKPLLLFIPQNLSALILEDGSRYLLWLPESVSFFFLCMFHGSANTLAHSSGGNKRHLIYFNTTVAWWYSPSRLWLLKHFWSPDCINIVCLMSDTSVDIRNWLLDWSAALWRGRTIPRSRRSERHQTFARVISVHNIFNLHVELDSEGPIAVLYLCLHVTRCGFLSHLRERVS